MGANQHSTKDLAEVTPLIDGRPCPSLSDKRLARHNPADGQRLADIPAGCAADVDRAVVSSRTAYSAGAWHRLAPSQKKALLYRWAELIEGRAPQLNRLDAIEMGKPISTLAFNAQAAAALVRFNAEALDKCAGDVLCSDRFSTVIQTRTPRGVIAAIVPWNFPTYNSILKIAPALAAGNCVILKPSELASQSALVLAGLALEAGIPPGVLNVVPGSGEIVGKDLAEHMGVDMVSFTGSSAVGKLIIQYAGRSNMKVVGAECGGKSPQIVFDDGLDTDAIARNIASMIVLNQGQVCSAGSRVLVQSSLEEVLVQKIIAHLEKVVIGDPLLASTVFGPLASEPQLRKVTSYVEQATQQGADLVYGGGRTLETTGGYFVEPAVFVNVAEDSDIAREEIFGPVLSILRFYDFDEAVRLANASCYGLAAYVWTSQAAVGFKLAHAMQTAVTVVNADAVPSSGAGCAFSGEPARLSGVGVEGGVAGLESYMRRQTLWFNHG